MELQGKTAIVTGATSCTSDPTKTPAPMPVWCFPKPS